MASVTKCSLLLLATLATFDGRAANGQESMFNQVKQTNTIITNDVNYMPAMMVIGKLDGSIVRCPHATPNTCELYHTGNSAVTATVVHGEFLYASLKSGALLRCKWHKKHSCYLFHQADDKITGLAVAADFIHAGLQNGTVLRCELNTPNSCEPFVDFGRNISSLAAFGSFIYAGSIGQIDRCSISQGNCSKFCSQGSVDVVGLAAIGDKVFGLRANGYIISAQQPCTECTVYSIPDYVYSGLAVYNRKLYAVRGPGDVRVLDPISLINSVFVKIDQAVSISFAYGTYAMQNRYWMESKKCIWKGIFKCPPTVFYYDVQSRSSLEVFVKNGLLYDSQGAMVDTSDSDESYTQKAAMFVMGPDGQILMSKVHKTGLLHTSSLLAGNPVSGAGLMVVEQGKIRNITSCSVHYRPDQDLNKQVIESLFLKGYTDPIDSHPCIYSETLCWAGNNYEDTNNNYR